MKKEDKIVRYDLNDKNDLFKYIKECEKTLGQLRLNGFSVYGWDIQHSSF